MWNVKRESNALIINGNFSIILYISFYSATVSLYGFRYFTHIHIHSKVHQYRVHLCVCMRVQSILGWTLNNRKTWVTFSFLYNHIWLIHTHTWTHAYIYAKQLTIATIAKSINHCSTFVTHKRKKKKNEIQNSKFILSIQHCARWYLNNLIIEFCKFSTKKPTLFHKNGKIGSKILWIELNGIPRSFTCGSKRDCNDDICSIFFLLLFRYWVSFELTATPGCNLFI